MTVFRASGVAVGGMPLPQPPKPDTSTQHDWHGHVYGTLWGCNACEARCYCEKVKAAFQEGPQTCVHCEEDVGVPTE